MSYRNFLFINIFIVRELWFFIDEEKKNPFNKYFFFLRNPMMWYIFQMSFRLLLNLIYHSAFIVIELCWRWLFFRAAERPKLFPFFFFFKRLCFALLFLFVECYWTFWAWAFLSGNISKDLSICSQFIIGHVLSQHVYTIDIDDEKW